MNFTDARHIARMSTEQVSEYLELSVSTIKRYEKTGKAPKAVIECLLMIGGKCPTFSLRNDFTGWSFGNGNLWSPSGNRFTSGDVLASRIDKQLVRDLARINKAMVIEMKKLKNSQVKSNVITFPSMDKRQGGVA